MAETTDLRVQELKLLGNLADSEALAQRVCEEVANTLVPHDGKELHVTLSIGVAASPPSDPDGPGLEGHAENALKRAKRDGKNRVIVA